MTKQDEKYLNKAKNKKDLKFRKWVIENRPSEDYGAVIIAALMLVGMIMYFFIK